LSLSSQTARARLLPTGSDNHTRKIPTNIYDSIERKKMLNMVLNHFNGKSHRFNNNNDDCKYITVPHDNTHPISISLLNNKCTQSLDYGNNGILFKLMGIYKNIRNQYTYYGRISSIKSITSLNGLSHIIKSYYEKDGLSDGTLTWI
jgi:hypothetical protein